MNKPWVDPWEDGMPANSPLDPWLDLAATAGLVPGDAEHEAHLRVVLTDTARGRGYRGIPSTAVSECGLCYRPLTPQERTTGQGALCHRERCVKQAKKFGLYDSVMRSD